MSTHNPTSPSTIGPDELWLVWAKKPLFDPAHDTDPILTKWMLAAPGEDGLKKLSSGESFGDLFLAAMPLSLLRQISDILPQSPSETPGWVKVALGSKDCVCLVRDRHGNARAIFGAEKRKRGERELVRGERKDFERLVQEGGDILANENWGRVFGDVRPFVVRGEIGWLHSAKNPGKAARIKEFLDDQD